MPIFDVQKKLEHGMGNPVSARLTLQAVELLEKSTLPKEITQKIVELCVTSLAPKLLRCWEIKERLEAERAKARGSYKPPGPGESAAMVPHIPRLEPECHNFLYEAKNFLRDLVTVFNLLHSTKIKEEASRWVRAEGEPGEVMNSIAKTYGEDHVNTRYIRQLPKCIAPYIAMRNAVEHPKDHSGELKIDDIVHGPDGKLIDPRWRREKDGKVIYGPFDVMEELNIAVHNLLILAEDILVMALQPRLAVPGDEIVAIPENARTPDRPSKYRVRPSAAAIAALTGTRQASQR